MKLQRKRNASWPLKLPESGDRRPGIATLTSNIANTGAVAYRRTAGVGVISCSNGHESQVSGLTPELVEKVKAAYEMKR